MSESMSEKIGFFDLEYNDCYYLKNPRSKQEQIEIKLGNWYCPIKNQIVNKKGCIKKKCNSFISFDQVMANLGKPY